MLKNANAETAQIPRIRPGMPTANAFNVLSEQITELESRDYISYMRALVILGVCILAAIVGNVVVNYWGADQSAKSTQLQECVMRINPDPNVNYQLEVYKCMNGN